MHIEAYRELCLSLKGVTESTPFDNKTLVFKVQNKMFALINIEDFTGVNLKCDPKRSINLREEYQGIHPGYHMSKKHWNTVSINSDVPSQLLKELTYHSYQLVVYGLTKKLKEELNRL